MILALMLHDTAGFIALSVTSDCFADVLTPRTLSEKHIKCLPYAVTTHKPNVCDWMVTQ